jgi:site-specific recombinase XerD
VNPLPALIQQFFTDWLPNQRRASPNTICAYRDTFKLLLGFAAQHHRTSADRLGFDQLDAATITAFLTHLETDRGNSPATRNARLAAIHALFRHAARQAPEHADTIARVAAIPPKRTDTRIVGYLNDGQVKLLLDTPDPDTWTGRRDRLLLAFMAHTGLRATETADARIDHIHPGPAPYIHTRGKGRKDRTTPLTPELAAHLAQWAADNGLAGPAPLFPTRSGAPLTRNGIWKLVNKHAAASAADHPDLATAHITPHVLRHSAAMRLLHAGIDIATIALWLGHENPDTTLTYLQADLERKQHALEQSAPPGVTAGRYKPQPNILAFLRTL